ncbi:hypothetical protein P5S46_17965 [Aeromonas caviae]|uniref:Double-GTPase 2 domain-containing protein n=2 Tax=Aeromonas caviae TaxID=648 RepID=A0AAJ6CRC1_AERCA|nr:hypothetical protein [Aeromonas caviae]ATP91767.1 hypothetical protein VI35_18240 [Aeromonas caviae]WFF97505.1 hypothetical protein P5S46_17965 [Aeromonas caviae]
MTFCSRATCFAPESTCDLGHLDRVCCSAWQNGSGTEQGELTTDELLLPWSGSALGLADLGFVTGRQKPLLVGIVGPQNAGKTTLLAAWYLLISRGLTLSRTRQFSGSYSLAGWSAVASALRWSPGQPPNFPPHTTSRGGRSPGLLHLDFRGTDGEVRGYLFADTPGEWFQKWAVNREAVDGEGARWVAEHADVFLLIADREALSGSSMGSARNSFQLLARRLSAESANRPVALVWTKSDIAITPEMEAAVREAVFSLMPNAREFSVSVRAEAESKLGIPDGLQDLLDWTLNVRRVRICLPPIQSSVSDPLFMFGTSEL